MGVVETATFTIGVCEKNQDPYWEILNRGFEKAAARFGFRISIAAPEREDFQEQERLLRSLVDQGVDALATVASDPTAFNPAIAEATSRGIPTICLDLDAPTSKRLLYVGTEEPCNLGRRAAAVMTDLLAPGARVAVQGGSEWAAGARGKRDGFLEAAKVAGLEIVAVMHDNHDPQAALANAKEIISTHPELDGLYGVYGYHPGAQLRALRELGIRRKIRIVGFDILPETLLGLNSGDIDASIWIQEYNFGYLGGAVLFNMLTLGVEETLLMLGLNPDSLGANAIRLAPCVLTPQNIRQFLCKYPDIVTSFS